MTNKTDTLNQTDFEELFKRVKQSNLSKKDQKLLIDLVKESFAYALRIPEFDFDPSTDVLDVEKEWDKVIDNQSKSRKLGD